MHLHGAVTAPLLVLLLLIATCAPGVSALSFNATTTDDGPLSEWLGSIVIDLPPVSVDIPLVLSVSLTNVSCGNIRAGGIAAELVPSNDSFTTWSLAGEAYGLCIDCAGSFSYGNRKNTTTGNFTLSFGNDTFVALSTVVRVLPADAEAAATAAAEYDDDTVATVPPHANVTVDGCDVGAVVTAFNATDPTLMDHARALCNAIEMLAPRIVCKEAERSVNSTVQPLVNGLLLIGWNILEDVQDSDDRDDFNALATSIGAGAALLTFTSFVLGYALYDCVVVGDDSPDKDTAAAAAPAAAAATATTHSLAINDGEVMPLTNRGGRGGNRSSLPSRSSLMRHGGVHWVIRYVLLFATLANLGAFVSSTFSVAGGVYMYLTTDGDTVTELPSLYTLTLIDSIVQMWQAGVWPLALVIAATSGFWPYIKLALMLLCYVLPPAALPVPWRKTLLQVLDALGKWSLIDSFVVVLFLEGFRIHIELSDGVQVDMWSGAVYGYYCYLAATMLSLTLCHCVLFLHNWVEDPRIHSRRKESVARHSFRARKGRMTCSTAAAVCVFVLLVGTMAAVVVGSLGEAFRYSYDDSLVGVLLQHTGGAVTKEFSLLELTRAIPDTRFYEDVGIRVIQVTFFLFTMVIPLLHLLSLLTIWAIPMTAAVQHGFFVVVEVLAAWGSLDVFVLAVVVALLELEQFAEFMVESKCRTINAVLEALFPDGPSGGTCLVIRSSLAQGSYILVGAVVVLLGTGYGVMYLCNRAIEDRITDERSSEVSCSS